MDHTSKGRVSGHIVSHRHIDALMTKHKDDAKALALIEFAGYLEQSKAIYRLVRNLPMGGEEIAYMIRETFAHLGAFTMKHLGFTTEEFAPIAQALKDALAKDIAETAALRADEAQADKFEREIREGQGADAAAAAIARMKLN